MGLQGGAPERRRGERTVRKIFVWTGYFCLGIFLLPVGATLFILLSPLVLGLFLLFIVLPNAYAVQFLGWARRHAPASGLDQEIVDEAGSGEPDGEGEEDRRVGPGDRLQRVRVRHGEIVEGGGGFGGDAGGHAPP